MKKVLIINGPNLDLLGKREPALYGESSLDEIKRYTDYRLRGQDVCLEWIECNRESDILEKMHHVDHYHGILLNPGALSHSSFSLYDCLRSLSRPVIEVHLTNSHRREFFRADRLSARACVGVIEGLGSDIYYLGVLALMQRE